MAADLVPCGFSAIVRTASDGPPSPTRDFCVLTGFALLPLTAAPVTRAFLLGVALATVPLAGHAQSDSAQVVSALTRFFDAARTKDTATVRAAFDDAARLTLLRPDPNGGVRVMTLGAQQFVQAVAGGSGLDEPIRNVKVMIDGDLASVWAEYQVRANGAVSHCGYDALHMVRRPGGWKILSIADSFRREGCGAAWK